MGVVVRLQVVNVKFTFNGNVETHCLTFSPGVMQSHPLHVDHGCMLAVWRADQANQL